MTCKDCYWNWRCGLERRGICTDFKLKDRQGGQIARHKFKRGGVSGQKEIRNRKKSTD